MRPNHHQFTAFAYVVREGSFSAAAARLGVTQSTVTQHLANLEKSVGTLLVLRGRDGVQLTPSGEDFYDFADRLVLLDGEVSDRLAGYNNMKRGRLKVIANAPQPALRIIQRFSQNHPDVEIDFGLHDWTTATGMVRSRLTDVGLITDAPQNDDWERIHVEQTHYVLYCRHDSRFAKQKQISLADLAQEMVIIPEQGSLTRKILDAKLRTTGLAFERSITMTSFPVMCEAVLQGIGVAIFLRNSSLIREGMVEVDISDLSERRDTWLIATKDRMRLRLTKEFVSAALE